MLLMVTFSSVSNTADITCNASFLSPCGVISPFSGLPPIISNALDMLNFQLGMLPIQRLEIKPKVFVGHQNKKGVMLSLSKHEGRPLPNGIYKLGLTLKLVFLRSATTVILVIIIIVAVILIVITATAIILIVVIAATPVVVIILRNCAVFHLGQVDIFVQ